MGALKSTLFRTMQATHRLPWLVRTGTLAALGVAIGWTAAPALAQTPMVRRPAVVRQPARPAAKAPSTTMTVPPTRPTVARPVVPAKPAVIVAKPAVTTKPAATVQPAAAAATTAAATPTTGNPGSTGSNGIGGAAADTTAPIVAFRDQLTAKPMAADVAAAADWYLHRFRSSDAAGLAARYAADAGEQRLFARHYDRELMLAFERALASNDAARLATVETALRATLGPLAGMTPAQLADRVSVTGSADPENVAMRDACLHLAMLYQVNRDGAHAERAAALLSKFAWAVPQWPVWNPYYLPHAQRQAMPQSSPLAFRSEYSAGLWGQWVYMDLIMGLPLVQARAFIAESGALKRINAEAQVARLFDLHLEVQRKYGATPDYSNMDSFQIRGKLEFGRYLPSPQLVHDGVDHMRSLLATGFYPDGWWHEGSPAYHFDLVRGLRLLCTELLQGYSDPPGFVSASGRRFDRLDLRREFAPQLDRADAVSRSMVLPDRTMMSVHDTPWPFSGPPDATAPTAPVLHGAMGQGSLVSGSGNGYAMATLHWGRAGTHSHADALRLHLWAKGSEVVSGNQYHPIPGSGSSREWHQSTAAQATVVVDGQEQSPVGRRGSRVRTPAPADAIPGITDWRWRWTQGQAGNDAGTLRFMSDRFAGVQVIEADAHQAYDAVVPVSMYRRTVALVRIDDADTYVVDVFRVRGGQTHDWMLHSALQSMQSLGVSPTLRPTGGSLGGWITGIESAAVADGWKATFALEDGTRMDTHMLGSPGTTVMTGNAPAMRRPGTAPFLVARRTGGDSTFVAIHHAYRGSAPRIISVEPVATDDPSAVAFRVRLGDREDIVYSGTDRNRLVRLGDGTEVRASFAHLASGGQRSWRFVADGDLLRNRDMALAGIESVEASVVATTSTDHGAATSSLALDRPSVAGLAGSTAVVDMGGCMSWAYRVSADAPAGGTSITIEGAPGFGVVPGGIKQHSFPGWGIPGSARVRIPGWAVAERSGTGPWTVEGTGRPSVREQPLAPMSVAAAR